jgi:flagellar hook assembly protein FlgD
MNSNTGINDLLPSECYLGQNYPDPFSETTTIKFCVAHKTRVTLEVFDSKGRVVKTLLDVEKEPGTHKAEFDASNLPEGIYTYQLQVGDFQSTKRMTLLRQKQMSIGCQGKRRAH